MASRHMVCKKSRLDAYAARYDAMPFHLGFNDCFLFCLRWADLLHGENIRASYQYHTKHGATKIIRDAKCNKAPDLFDLHFNQTESPVIGDLVEFSTPHVLGGCAVYAGEGISYTILIGGGLGLVKGYSKAWAV